MVAENAMKRLTDVLVNLKNWTTKAFKPIWNLYVLFLDWSVFSAIGADGLSVYICAAIMTLVLLFGLFVSIVTIVALAYGIACIIFSNVVVSLAFAVLTAAIVVAVHMAAKSWNEENNEGLNSND